MLKIPRIKGSFNQEEIRAVTRVLQTGLLMMGPEVKELEERIKSLIGVHYAVATNSGTSSLHLSLIALGVGKGEEVIIPTYTCSALLNAVNYVGASPVLVDNGEGSLNISARKVEEKITQKTKAIIVQHTFGFPAEVDKIIKLRVPVVEDCGAAIGSTYKGRLVGSFGNIGTFSFYASKILSAGQGGIVVTDNKKYYDIVYDLIRYDKRTKYKDRYNYQMADITAAIANVQLKKMKSFIKRRKEIAAKYIDVLKGKKNIRFWPDSRESNANHYRFIIQFPDQKSRNKILKFLEKSGVTTIVPYLNYQLLHNYLKLNKANFPVAENLSNNTITIPLYPELTEIEIRKIISLLDKAIV